MSSFFLNNIVLLYPTTNKTKRATRNASNKNERQDDDNDNNTINYMDIICNDYLRYCKIHLYKNMTYLKMITTPDIHTHTHAYHSSKATGILHSSYLISIHSTFIFMLLRCLQLRQRLLRGTRGRRVLF